MSSYFFGNHKRIGGKSKTAHRTTILINKEDWEFLSKYGYKPTNLLRKKIKELQREKEGMSIDFEKANARLVKLNQTIFDTLAANLSEEEYNKILVSLNEKRKNLNN